MWLLDVHSRKLCAFEGSRIPEYAILSHRWEDEEVLFQDIEKSYAVDMKGYYKIDLCCKRAIQHNFKYVWVDTCCIDKRSSAELSEAINSMYMWYSKARICHAYLSDVTAGDDLSFKKSQWFKRGWTLQELLAPEELIFFDKDWSFMGTKFNLVECIKSITGIERIALIKFNPKSFDIAMKMSWAKDRVTTREEDIAYCLLGLFGVHMPLIYGEGSQAFVRFQENILSAQSDRSILLWNGKANPDFGLLALSPSSFTNILNPGIETSKLDMESKCDHTEHMTSDQGIVLSNVGIMLRARLIPWSFNIFFAPIKIYFDPDTTTVSPKISQVGILLVRRYSDWAGENYQRTSWDFQSTISVDWVPEFDTYPLCEVMIRKSPLINISSTKDTFLHGFRIEHLDNSVLHKLFVGIEHGSDISVKVIRDTSTTSCDLGQFPIGAIGITGMICIAAPKQLVVIHVGLDDLFNPLCLITRLDILEPWPKSYTDLRFVYPGCTSVTSLDSVSLGDKYEIMQIIHHMTKDDGDGGEKTVDHFDHPEAFRGCWKKAENYFIVGDVQLVFYKTEDTFAYCLSIERTFSRGDNSVTSAGVTSLSLRRPVQPPKWECVSADEFLGWWYIK